MRSLLLCFLTSFCFPHYLLGQCDPVIVGSDEFCQSSGIHLLQLNGVWENIFWTTTDGDFTSSALPNSINLLSPGTYCVQAFDYFGCSSETCITVNISNCIDIDLDGFYANVDPQDPNYDPDDNDRCIPNACIFLCDYDSDGIPNTLDDDDDNDGCLDGFGNDPCSSGDDIIVVAKNWTECYVEGEEYVIYIDIHSNIPIDHSQLSYRWEMSIGSFGWIDMINSFPTNSATNFSGANSNTLILTNLTALNGSCFRSYISQEGNACQNIYSNTICLDDIVSTNIQSTSLCPSTTETCEKACVSTSVTYSVDNPDDKLVYWSVDGSNEYSINGDEVSVNWEESGTGEVSVELVEDGDYLNVNCGQRCNVNIAEGLKGAAFLMGHSTLGAEFEVEYSSGGGNTWNDMIPGYPYYFEELEAGTYTYLVRDGAGNQKECSVEITDYTTETVFPGTIISASCTNNNAVYFRGASSFCSSLIPPNEWVVHYAMELVHIETGETILDTFSVGLVGPTAGAANGLLPGDYIATFTNNNNEQIISEFTIPCVESCIQTASQCVNILPEPRSNFTTEPPAINGIIDLCKAESIQFNNQSEHSTAFIWDFGDGTTTLVKDPLKTFYEPGIYEVRLISRNDCICADTLSIMVQVSNAEVPEIECIGPICQGESATYSTNVDCSNYSWNISPNGTILSGGGSTDDFISVQWNDGETGIVQMQVTGCQGNICPKPVREEVSIISPQVDIHGPIKVCRNSETEYFINAIDGADYQWYTSNNAIILEGQYTNVIRVKWDDSSSYGYVRVEYENCMLECSGMSQLNVQIPASTYLEGPIEICQETNPTFYHRNVGNGNLSNANWSITNENGDTIWQSNGITNQISPLWDFPFGKYNVSATPPNGSCKSIEGLDVQLLPPPPAVEGIEGAENICPDQFYNYTAISQLDNATFDWFIYDGSTISQKSGKSINIKWGTQPPYSLSVIQKNWDGPGCVSPPTLLKINALPDFNIIGEKSVCREDSYFYSAELHQDMNYEWSVIPPSAGAILEGQGTNEVEVFWQQKGDAVLQLNACGLVTSLNIEINEISPPTIIHPESICEGETAIISTTGNYLFYQWQNETGQTISADPTPQLSGGHYKLIVRDQNGCAAEVSYSINEWPKPIAEISTPIYLSASCDGLDVELFCLQTEGGTDYQWFQDNSPVGFNQPSLTTQETGTYHVVLTNQFGCTQQSNEIEIRDCEDAGGECINGSCIFPNGGGSSEPVVTPGCEPLGELDFLPQAIDCNTYSFENLSSNFIPNTISWDFGDPTSGIDNESTEISPTHTFSHPGYYWVRLSGAVPNANDPNSPCGLTISKQIIVPLKTIFAVEESCLGAPTNFTDLSVFLPMTGITTWQWDFGDPASGANNISSLQHPSHTFSSAGAFTVTLTSTSTTGCSLSFSKIINVHEVPTAFFQQPEALCAATALNFTATSNTATANYHWDFGDPASGAANVSKKQSTWHAYPQASNYNVELTVISPYGCESIYSNSVAIESNNLVGNVTPNEPAPICEGLSINLTAPSGGNQWTWSNGSNENTITISQAGIYEVTITDNEGCTYTPPSVALETLPKPTATIRAVELNEFGQVEAYHENSFSACEGTDVFLEMSGDERYSYVWSDGTEGDWLAMSDADSSLLSAGDYSFSVTITDTYTGCTSEEGPFPITIHALPVDVVISSDPEGPICEGTEANFWIENIDPTLEYLWNTGQQGTTISALAGGTYLVLATNENGCSTKSNEIQIHNAPNIGSVTQGCFDVCETMEICLPNMPEIGSYQWYLNSDSIPAPSGEVANYIATEDGSYQVLMTSIYGCETMSNPINLNFLENEGEVIGNVWLDINENDEIDPTDSLLSGITVDLLSNDSLFSQIESNANGVYIFTEIDSGQVELQLNTDSLSAQFAPILAYGETTISGCNDSTGVDFLVRDLCVNSIEEEVVLQACLGDSIFYENTEIAAGGTEIFTYNSFSGCDSTVTVFVESIEIDTTYLTLTACSNESVGFNGTELLPGASQPVILASSQQCDSVIWVEVEGIELDTQKVELNACEGETITYNGLPIVAGDSHLFTHTSFSGCDSVEQVFVEVFFMDSTYIELEVCHDETIEYEGVTYSQGDTDILFLTNQRGCDSLVFISVTAFPAIEFETTTNETCPGDADGFIEINSTTGDGPFTYSLNEVDFQNDPYIDNLQSGTYTIWVKDQNGCMKQIELYISERDSLIISTNDYILPCGNDYLTLSPTIESHSGELNWTWPNGSDRDWYITNTAGQFAFTVQDECTAIESTINVFWDDNRPEQAFYIPNAFSPNGDGINDYFRPFPAEGVVVHSYSIHIFDRWGGYLFATSDIDEGWNGIFRDVEMQVGVYSWYLEADVEICGKAESLFEKGDVTIIK